MEIEQTPCNATEASPPWPSDAIISDEAQQEGLLVEATFTKSNEDNIPGYLKVSFQDTSVSKTLGMGNQGNVT
ncbi:hypothetical protein M5689_021397 [Euphorbia peplus]|nr:hypothetical protein M5689_021397 [Euphorbia peplus]